MVKFTTVTTEEEAKVIEQFFLSENAFDDRRYTPGEIERFKQHPIDSLKQEGIYYWYAKNDTDGIIAAFGVIASEQKTGGYELAYIAIHKAYRRYGIARDAFNHIENFVKDKGGRFLILSTCDLKEYVPMRKLVEELGFKEIGYYPDYYFEGESMLVYYKKLRK